MLVWNWLAFGIFTALLSQLFFLLAYVFLLCNTKIHFLETSLCFTSINYYLQKNRFCCLSSFCFSVPFFHFPFVSPFTLVANSLFSPPSTASSSCLVILMCWVFHFSCCFSVCLLSGPHQKHWATLSQWYGTGAEGKCHR